MFKCYKKQIIFYIAYAAFIIQIKRENKIGFFIAFRKRQGQCQSSWARGYYSSFPNQRAGRLALLMTETQANNNEHG